MEATCIAARLRERGMRLTATRWAIIQHLEGNDRHPSAQEIFDALQATHPGLSLTTVYSTLATLEEMGVLAALPQADGGRRYDPNLRPHVNLVCRACGRVADAPADALAALLQEAANAHGFTIGAPVVEAQGVCPDCRSKDGGGDAGAGAASA